MFIDEVVGSGGKSRSYMDRSIRVKGSEHRYSVGNAGRTTFFFFTSLSTNIKRVFH